MRHLLAYIASALILAGCSAGHEPSLSDKLDTYFAERYPLPDEPGGAVIIAQGDSIIYERYFGVADLATGERVDSATRFNIASVSKQFTVAGLMQTGVDIDRPVCNFEPWPQPFWHEVTLRHLASHTSGVPDSRDRSDRQRCIEATDATSMEYFPAIDSLKFAPGTAYDYLNPSFLILAQVVEQQCGMEFVKAQQKYIFEPAGMSSTFYYEPDTVAPHMAHGYEPVDGNWQEYDYGEETFFATRPDGGIYSTARDMLRWERALARGTVLDSASVAEAYSPHVDVSSSPWCDYQRRPATKYGLGWFIDDSEKNRKIYHTGDNGGFQAYVAKYPALDISIIVLENRHDRDRWAMARFIDSLVVGR